MGNGEFVSPEAVEAVLDGAVPGVEQLLVFPLKEKDHLVR